MDEFLITGGRPLKGKVEVGGSKNAALPILISSILAKGESTFHRVPNLKDIQTTLQLLSQLGFRCESKSLNTIRVIETGHPILEAPYDLVKTMRASVLVLGPLLARFRKAKVSLPGGCAIGARPVNFHLKAFKEMGAEIDLESGYIVASAPKGLSGARIQFEFPSVGATENVMMAAPLAKGETVIENAACEPEIIDLANCLRKMGAKIEGDGTPTIYIQGGHSHLSPVEYSVMGDRIEAGTFLIAGAITGGEVEVSGSANTASEALLEKLKEAGVHLDCVDENTIRVRSSGELRAVSVETAPYPGFPTDMQAQFMALMTQAKGTSEITETIFENRFMHVPELTRLGCEISLNGRIATVKGTPGVLKGAPMMATDLRASAGLILAALTANGQSRISRIYHIDRGYEKIEEKLSQLGAQIERTKGPSPEGGVKR